MPDLIAATSQAPLIGLIAGLAAVLVVLVMLLYRSQARARHETLAARDETFALREELRQLQASQRGEADRGAAATSSDPFESTEIATATRMEPPTVPEDIVSAVAGGEAVLFAGAGLAAEAGYPLYADALERVIDRLDDGENDQTWTALRRQLKAGEVELTADLLLRRVGEAALRDRLRDVAGSHANASTPTLDELAKLPLAGVITDDWYGVIAERLGRGALLLAPWSSGAAADVLRSGRRFVLEAYGGVDRSRLIVGFDDYRAELQDNRDYARFVASVLTTRCLVFLGASLRGVEQFLLSSDLRAGGERSHWAFVPWQPDLALQEERLSRYGVKLLAYDPQKPAGAVAHVVSDLRARADGAALRPHARQVLRHRRCAHTGSGVRVRGS